MNTKHKPATALPWVLGQRDNGTSYVQSLEAPQDTYTKAQLNADAAYICHASNAYPELVEALVKIVRYADSEPDGGDFVEMHRANVERARAILAKLGEA